MSKNALWTHQDTLNLSPTKIGDTGAENMSDNTSWIGETLNHFLNPQRIEPVLDLFTKVYNL